ncbi:hypothetical protein M427DRAFT_145926 [Gonapodya prolifera JEL478]|uniref:BTB domain-containing protein n=1 Tax=Gonapodya prolifera (strain JEL478) TaxID=1344416 RepID=A0A139ADA1_GONPJ|nr:hypothetical protein M427DRAFT_145926 [Gonapodya prolifera JEL478]|eukprot:KXS14750.1 hypothetical protein M427DRAFT_145926 [Gonapodya prolifera JEL478]
MLTNGESSSSDPNPPPNRRRSQSRDRPRRAGSRDRATHSGSARESSPSRGRPNSGVRESPFLRKGGLHGYLKLAKYADALLKIKTTDNKMTTVPCHRLVLSLRSDFFETLFASTPNPPTSTTPQLPGVLLPVYQLPPLPPHRSLHEVVGKILWALYNLESWSLAVQDTKWDEIVGVLRVAGAMDMTHFTAESERAIADAIEGHKGTPDDLDAIAREAQAWGLVDVRRRAMGRLAELYERTADLDGPELFNMTPARLGVAIEHIEPPQQFEVVRKYLNTRNNSASPVAPDAASELWSKVSFRGLSLAELEAGFQDPTIPVVLILDAATAMALRNPAALDSTTQDLFEAVLEHATSSPTQPIPAVVQGEMVRGFLAKHPDTGPHTVKALWRQVPFRVMSVDELAGFLGSGDGPPGELMFEYLVELLQDPSIPAASKATYHTIIRALTLRPSGPPTGPNANANAIPQSLSDPLLQPGNRSSAILGREHALQSQMPQTASQPHLQSSLSHSGGQGQGQAGQGAPRMRPSQQQASGADTQPGSYDSYLVNVSRGLESSTQSSSPQLRAYNTNVGGAGAVRREPSREMLPTPPTNISSSDVQFPPESAPSAVAGPGHRSTFTASQLGAPFAQSHAQVVSRQTSREALNSNQSSPGVPALPPTMSVPGQSQTYAQIQYHAQIQAQVQAQAQGQGQGQGQGSAPPSRQPSMDPLNASSGSQGMYASRAAAVALNITTPNGRPGSYYDGAGQNGAHARTQSASAAPPSHTNAVAVAPRPPPRPARTEGSSGAVHADGFSSPLVSILHVVDGLEPAKRFTFIREYITHRSALRAALPPSVKADLWARVPFTQVPVPDLERGFEDPAVPIALILDAAATLLASNPSALNMASSDFFSAALEHGTTATSGPPHLSPLAQYEAVKSYAVSRGAALTERTRHALWSEVKFSGMTYDQLDRARRESIAPTQMLIDAMLAMYSRSHSDSSIASNLSSSASSGAVNNHRYNLSSSSSSGAANNTQYNQHQQHLNSSSSTASSLRPPLPEYAQRSRPLSQTFQPSETSREDLNKDAGQPPQTVQEQHGGGTAHHSESQPSMSPSSSGEFHGRPRLRRSLSLTNIPVAAYGPDGRLLSEDRADQESGGSGRSAVSMNVGVGTPVNSGPPLLGSWGPRSGREQAGAQRQPQKSLESLLSNWGVSSR